MLYEYIKSEFSSLTQTSFIAEGILERQHIQRALVKDIGIVSSDCLVIAEEFSLSEWSESGRRIDILAIDKEANIVIIELKRDETGAHMELQAIRYAAIVSTLTYQKVLRIYRRHLAKEEIEMDAEQSLLEFLDWDEPNEDEFALDVRLMLTAANFSKEITSTVLWLNEKNVDIRCVRIILYRLEEKVIIDVQQIISLPEGEEYQIRLREKKREQRRATQTRDYTKYQFQGNVYNKRRLVLAVIQAWVEENKPDSMSVVQANFPQQLHSKRLLLEKSKAEELAKRQRVRRHFLDDSDLIQVGDTLPFAVSNQWGKGNIERFIDHTRKLGYTIEPVKEGD